MSNHFDIFIYLVRDKWTTDNEIPAAPYIVKIWKVTNELTTGILSKVQSIYTVLLRFIIIIKYYYVRTHVYLGKKKKNKWIPFVKKVPASEDNSQVLLAGFTPATSNTPTFDAQYSLLVLHTFCRFIVSGDLTFHVMTRRKTDKDRQRPRMREKQHNPQEKDHTTSQFRRVINFLLSFERVSHQSTDCRGQ